MKLPFKWWFCINPKKLIYAVVILSQSIFFHIYSSTDKKKNLVCGRQKVILDRTVMMSSGNSHIIILYLKRIWSQMLNLCFSR